jgi:outer membrane protein
MISKTFRKFLSRRLCLGVAALCVIQNAWPAPGTDLVDAWHAALTHEAGYSAARAANAAAQEKKAQGDALLAPQVLLTSSATHASQSYRPGDVTTKVSTDQDGQQYRAAVALVKPLYEAGKSVTREQLYRETAQAEVTFKQAEQDLMLRTAKAYFEVLVATKSLDLLRAQKQAISEQLDLATQSYELGLMTASDVNDARAKLDGVVALEIAGQNDQEGKQLVFRQLTGLDPVQLVAMSDKVPSVVPDMKSLDEWLAQAQANNLAIQATQLSVEIAHLDIARYKLRNSPILELVTSAGRNWDIGSISASGGRDTTNNAAIGLQLSIPLYDGGGRASHLRQALALEDQQRFTLEAVRADTDRTTRFFFAAVRDNSLRVVALNQARISSSAALESTRIGREVGVRTIIDMLNAQQNVYLTLYNLTSARYDHLFSKIQLWATAGALDEYVLRKITDDLARP